MGENKVTLDVYKQRCLWTTRGHANSAETNSFSARIRGRNSIVLRLVEGVPKSKTRIRYGPDGWRKRTNWREAYWDKNREYWSAHDPYQEIPSKGCPACRTVKPSTEFYKSPSNKCGLMCKCIACLKEYYRKHISKRLIENARSRAQRDGTEFSITTADIVVPNVCPVLGIPIEVGDGKWHDGSPTVDRWDNVKGYTPENIHVISWRANSLKGDATVAELEKVLEYMRRVK